MRALDEHDLFLVRRKLPKHLVTVLQDAEVSAYVAGGFIRAVVAKEEPSDIDLFVSSGEMAESISKKLLWNNGDLRRIDTANAITFYDHGRLGGLPIQVITRWYYEEPHALVNGFDFTVCQAAVWWVRDSGGFWNSAAQDRFYTDLASKRLRYTAPARNEDAGGSLLRVLKYYRRGYTIPLTDMGLVIARLMGGCDTSKVDISNQHALGLVIRGLLREVDPLVDPDHIVSEQEPQSAPNQEQV